MTQELYKFLDKQISLSGLESFVYKSPALETHIGEDNYQALLEFNYNKKNADLELQNLLIREIIQENEFANWKVNLLLNSLELGINSNLFSAATNNSNILKDNNLSFYQFTQNNKIEIEWLSNIHQFHRHNSKLKNEVKFLHLGTYDNSYIHLLVNKDNEIWIGYDIINKEEFFAKNLFEALKRLLVKGPY